MKKRYRPTEIDSYWQKYWAKEKLFTTPVPQPGLRNIYVKVAWPFTSGTAHLGHAREYVMGDVYARFRRSHGDSVLFTLGFDAFGLPNEMAAIRHKYNPEEWATTCRERMIKQFTRLGISFDWNRSAITCDPDCYKWTQFVFVKLLQADFVYRNKSIVYWCDQCQTSLASLQVQENQCWRCGQEVCLKLHEQWFLRTSRLFHALEKNLDILTGWDKKILVGQRLLIGKTQGVEVLVSGPGGVTFPAFTPHTESIPDASFVAAAPNNEALQQMFDQSGVSNNFRANDCRWKASGEWDDDLPAIVTNITVSILGTEQRLPLIITPLVNTRFGGGAWLGIPSVDNLDRRIATALALQFKSSATTDTPPCIPALRYKSHDISLSRQRFWATPIPVVYCAHCGVVPVPFEELPVKLPTDIHHLAGLKQCQEFVHTKCPTCGRNAERETDTFDCHMDSLWLFVLPCVPKDDRPISIFDHPEVRQWLPIERMYWGSDGIGYMQNIRFFGLAMNALGLLTHIPNGEPVTNATMHGMVLTGGAKMSKHDASGVDPDSLVDEFGADAVRLALMQSASPGSDINWDNSLVRSTKDIIDKIWVFYNDLSELFLQWREYREADVGNSQVTANSSKKLVKWNNTAIDRIVANFEKQQFHLACINLLRFFSLLQKWDMQSIPRELLACPNDMTPFLLAARNLLLLMSPILPHIAEELWRVIGEPCHLSSKSWTQLIVRL